MTHRHISWLVALTIITCCTVSTQAQLLINPSIKADYGLFDSEASFSFATVEYDGGEVERKVLGGYVAYGIHDLLDVYGAGGLIFGAEPEDWGDSGEGFMLAIGTRCDVVQMEQLSINAYAQLQYLSEDYGSNSFSDPENPEASISIDAEGNVTELVLGSVARLDITDQLSVYGGLELVPYSDGEAEADSSLDIDVASGDIERDKLLGLRGGVSYDFGSWWLRGELALLSEQTFTLGAAFYF
jgi:hypothetical protein